LDNIDQKRLVNYSPNQLRCFRCFEKNLGPQPKRGSKGFLEDTGNLPSWWIFSIELCCFHSIRKHSICLDYKDLKIRTEFMSLGRQISMEDCYQ